MKVQRIIDRCGVRIWGFFKMYWLNAINELVRYSTPISQTLELEGPTQTLPLPADYAFHGTLSFDDIIFYLQDYELDTINSTATSKRYWLGDDGYYYIEDWTAKTIEFQKADTKGDSGSLANIDLNSPVVVYLNVDASLQFDGDTEYYISQYFENFIVYHIQKDAADEADDFQTSISRGRLAYENLSKGKKYSRGSNRMVAKVDEMYAINQEHTFGGDYVIYLSLLTRGE